MPTVLSFWQLPEEETTFLEFLEADGAVALLDRWYRVEEQLHPFRPVDCTHTGKGAYLFTRPEFVPTLLWIPVPRQENSFRCVWSTGSCVLVYRRGHVSGKKLFLATASFDATYWDANRNKVRKPKEFLSWARRVVAWLKDRASCREWLRSGFFPATPGVSAAVREKRVELQF